MFPLLVDGIVEEEAPDTESKGAIHVQYRSIKTSRCVGVERR